MSKNSKNPTAETPQKEQTPTAQNSAITLVKDVAKIMKKATALNQKVEAINLLNDTHRNLDSFKTGSDTLKDTLTIRDGDGREFKTHNSEIIDQTIDFIKAKILQKIESFEKELIAIEQQ